MPTNFPKSGDDKKISLFNSEYPQFDYDYALDLRENYPDIWRKGGNIRGNSAFTNWGKARDGVESESTLDWIKEREAWAARHYKNFRIAGVIAQIKWGVIGSRGEGYMKELVNEQKQNTRSIWDRITDYIKKELGFEQRAMSLSQMSEQILQAFYSSGSMDYPVDIYADKNTYYLLTTSGGKLYRYPVEFTETGLILAPKVQVMETHKDIATRTVIRNSQGQKRWVSISATSVLNRDGEIDSKQLFDSFIQHAETTNEYPIRMFYHAGEQFRIGQADFLARDENCYITSGIFDDTEIAQRAAKAIELNPQYWGESIGYIPTSQPELYEIERGIKIPVYTSGINIEISQLPEQEAANLFTITEGVNRMLNGKQLEAFYQLFEGDKEAAENWLTNNAETRNRQIAEQELITRNQQEGEMEEKKDVVIDDTVIDEIVSRVTKNNQDLSESINKLSEELETANSVIDTFATQISNLEKENEKLRSVVDILKAEYDTRIQIRNQDKTTETRIVYKPRQVEQTEEQPKSFAEIAAARLPKNAY